MKIYQAFRYELKPSIKQKILLAKHAGVARFSYNWGLARVRDKISKPNTILLHKELCALKKSQFPWMYEVSKCAPQESLRDLERAFKDFFARRTGFPQFKKKGRDDSFRLTGTIKVIDKRHIQLPRIGIIRTKESTEKFQGRILSATVKREADRWYVSLHVERDRKIPELKLQGVIGIDCNTSAIVTNDTIYELPKALSKKLQLLKKRSKQLSRKKKGSNNRKKSAIRLARLHRKIRNIRRDALHKISTHLAKTKQVIVVESLGIRRMVQNSRVHRLNRSVLDAGWAIFLTMLAYKTLWYGSRLVRVPANFPSTRCCSRCGFVVEKMPLSQRVFLCPKCNFIADRDINAAINLRNYGLAHLTSSTASSAGSNACGDSSGGGTVCQGRSTSHESLKQEVPNGIKFHTA
jgi:putative transposase